MIVLPWEEVTPLDAAHFAQIRLDTIFDCYKWDPQVEDVAILANFPLILQRDAWLTIARQAELLAAETLAAEAELRMRPDAWQRLGLPAAITRLWQHARPALHNARDVRVMRFDFHFTDTGWRISEVNADVPGGFNEASGFTRLMAQAYPQAQMNGDPAATLATAIRRHTEPGAVVALIHATAYTDDRQVMLFLAKHLEAHDLRPYLVSPANIAWNAGHAYLDTEWQRCQVEYLLRFYPAEWLPNLPATTLWQHFFTTANTPRCNPTTALLVQSKRFPLVWDMLQTDLPTWRELLPATADPRMVNYQADDDWIVKPALGRIGEGIGIVGVTDAKDWRQIKQSAHKHPERWVAQRRFMAVPLVVAGVQWYPVIGVYTVDGRAAGAYGRIGSRPLINALAKDIAILVSE